MEIVDQVQSLCTKLMPRIQYSTAGDPVDAPASSGCAETSRPSSSYTAANSNASSNCNTERTANTNNARYCSGSCSMAARNGNQEIDLSTVKLEAISLSRDIVQYFIMRDTGAELSTNNRHAVTLRRIVDALIEKHELAFSGMVRKLGLEESGDRSISTKMESVARDMFSDNIYNWGRVATLYAFAGLSARYCQQNGVTGTWADDIANTVGEFVAERLGEWIVRQGGWDDMDRMFPPDGTCDLESRLWKGLMCTMLGLGALAVAAVR